MPDMRKMQLDFDTWFEPFRVYVTSEEEAQDFVQQTEELPEIFTRLKKGE